MLESPWKNWEKMLENFMKPVKEKNITLNKENTVRKVNYLKILGYKIENGKISSDQDRLKPLLEMQLPTKSQNGAHSAFDSGHR